VRSRSHHRRSNIEGGEEDAPITGCDLSGGDPLGRCAPRSAGAPTVVDAGESTTVAGAEETVPPVTMICPIMKGWGVQV